MISASFARPLFLNCRLSVYLKINLIQLISTVNFLVSDHPCCTTKWSLKEGGRLMEKNEKKYAQTELLTVIT